MAPETATAPDPKVQVKPLLCPSCSGAVPLGDGDHLTCPYCGASVPVPESYRAIRDANRVAEADRASVQAAYARLGKPPGLFLWVWARAAKVALWISFPMFWIWILLTAFTFTRRLGEVALQWGFYVPDVIGVFGYATACSVLLGLILLVPTILFRYRTSNRACRGMLAAGLAAEPPSTPGGPAICRECGAPLSVVPGALGVRCGYCGTDNLVALPIEWVNRMTSTSAGHHHDVASALDAEMDERSKARRRLIWQLIASTMLVGLSTVSIGGILADGLPAWRGAVAGNPRVLVREHVNQVIGYPFVQELQSGSQSTLTFSKDECAESTCSLVIAVPLRRGETFELDSPDLPRNTTASAKTRWDLNPWQAVPAGANLYRYSEQGHTGAITLTAPFSGWFIVRATLPGIRPNPKMSAHMDARITIGSRA